VVDEMTSLTHSHYLLNHMVLMCWRKEDEVCLDDSDPVLTAEE